MKRLVEDYWLPPDVPSPEDVPARQIGFRMPATAKTYRRCTAQVQKKGKLSQCEEAALVPWAKRDGDHRGKCKKHGGAK